MPQYQYIGLTVSLFLLWEAESHWVLAENYWIFLFEKLVSYYGSLAHCFLLLQVSGVEGIMAAYAMALHNVALAGPTLFGPVISKAAEIAAQSLSIGQNKYYVLLLITVTIPSVLAFYFISPQFFFHFIDDISFTGRSYYRFARNHRCHREGFWFTHVDSHCWSRRCWLQRNGGLDVVITFILYIYIPVSLISSSSTPLSQSLLWNSMIYP